MTVPVPPKFPTRIPKPSSVNVSIVSVRDNVFGLAGAYSRFPVNVTSAPLPVTKVGSNPAPATNSNPLGVAAYVFPKYVIVSVTAPLTRYFLPGTMTCGVSARVSKYLWYSCRGDLEYVLLKKSTSMSLTPKKENSPTGMLYRTYTKNSFIVLMKT